ncbi:MAG: hypothetical protein AB1508_16930 [Pseudomonadota bacterium]
MRKIIAGLALLGIAAVGFGAAYWHDRQSAEQDLVLCGGEHGGTALPPLPSVTPVTGNSLVSELRTKAAPVARC